MQIHTGWNHLKIIKTPVKIEELYKKYSTFRIHLCPYSRLNRIETLDSQDPFLFRSTSFTLNWFLIVCLYASFTKSHCHVKPIITFFNMMFEWCSNTSTRILRIPQIDPYLMIKFYKLKRTITVSFMQCITRILHSGIL